MRTAVTAALVGSALFLAGCGNIPEKTRTYSLSSERIIDGKIGTLQVDADRASSIKPTTIQCSAWNYSLDTSGVGRSIEKSLRNSFNGNASSGIYDFKVEVEQHLEFKIVPGYFSATAEGNSEMEARVAVHKDGEYLYTRSYDVDTRRSASMSTCQEGLFALKTATEKTTKKLVTRILEDMQREIESAAEKRHFDNGGK